MSDKNIKIIKEKDDPICTRVSIGGKEELGFYGVYRGEIEDAINCVEIVLKELKKEDFKHKLEMGYFDEPMSPLS